jgi:putative flippase GtrA
MNSIRWREIYLFLLVGILAGAAHFCMVLLLVERFSLQPLDANLIAFFFAFWISFLGHCTLTFRDATYSNNRRIEAAGKFSIVAIGGFTINQMSYAWLLQLAPDTSYLILLFFTQAFVAFSTFLLSRLWAFSR